MAKEQVIIDSLEFYNWVELVEANLISGNDVILDNYNRGFHLDRCEVLAKRHRYQIKIEPDKLIFSRKADAPAPQ